MNTDEEAERVADRNPEEEEVMEDEDNEDDTTLRPDSRFPSSVDQQYEYVYRVSGLNLRYAKRRTLTKVATWTLATVSADDEAAVRTTPANQHIVLTIDVDVLPVDLLTNIAKTAVSIADFTFTEIARTTGCNLSAITEIVSNEIAAGEFIIAAKQQCLDAQTQINLRVLFSMLTFMPVYLERKIISNKLNLSPDTAIIVTPNAPTISPSNTASPRPGAPDQQPPPLPQPELPPENEGANSPIHLPLPESPPPSNSWQRPFSPTASSETYRNHQRAVEQDRHETSSIASSSERRSVTSGSSRDTLKSGESRRTALSGPTETSSEGGSSSTKRKSGWKDMRRMFGGQQTATGGASGGTPSVDDESMELSRPPSVPMSIDGSEGQSEIVALPETMRDDNSQQRLDSYKHQQPTTRPVLDQPSIQDTETPMSIGTTESEELGGNSGEMEPTEITGVAAIPVATPKKWSQVDEIAEDVTPMQEHTPIMIPPEPQIPRHFSREAVMSIGEKIRKARDKMSDKMSKIIAPKITKVKKVNVKWSRNGDGKIHMTGGDSSDNEKTSTTHPPPPSPPAKHAPIQSVAAAIPSTSEQTTEELFAAEDEATVAPTAVIEDSPRKSKKRYAELDDETTSRRHPAKDSRRKSKKRYALTEEGTPEKKQHTKPRTVLAVPEDSRKSKKRSVEAEEEEEEDEKIHTKHVEAGGSRSDSLPDDVGLRRKLKKPRKPITDTVPSTLITLADKKIHSIRGDVKKSRPEVEFPSISKHRIKQQQQQVTSEKRHAHRERRYAQKREAADAAVSSITADDTTMGANVAVVGDEDEEMPLAAATSRRKRKPQTSGGSPIMSSKKSKNVADDSSDNESMAPSVASTNTMLNNLQNMIID